MERNNGSSEDVVKLYNEIFLREKLERQATGAITSDIITKLKVPIEALPPRCQQLLHQVAKNQSDLDIQTLDSITLSLRQSKEQSDQLQDDYEILKLKQKNAELQAKIDRNNVFLEGLRRELANSKNSLANSDPNPDNIQDYIRQLKQKLRSYEESCEKAKSKWSKLCVPESALPATLAARLEALDALRRDAEPLRLRAEDAALARQAREAFGKLRK